MSQALLKEEALPTITVTRVPTLDGEGVLVLREPLVFHPTFDGEYYSADYKPLHVFTNEEDFDMLEPAILDQIAFMWDRYVCAPEERLAPDAIAEKQIIRAHFV